MTVRQTRGDVPVGGGEAPPPDPVFDPTDEGPMRRELLRQIAYLEVHVSRFARDNVPFERLPAVTRRGPALLPTAALEDIRDELLGVRAELHERVVERVRGRLVDDDGHRRSRRREP